MEFSTWTAAEASTTAALTLPPSPHAEQWSPAPDTPHSSLLSHCFIYSWLTCSRGSAPPFWGVEISCKGLYNFKWWQWLYRWNRGIWHREVIKRMDGLLILTVRHLCWYCLTYLFYLLTAGWKEVMWVKCPAQGCITPWLTPYFTKWIQLCYFTLCKLQLVQPCGRNAFLFHHQTSSDSWPCAYITACTVCVKVYKRAV